MKQARTPPNPIHLVWLITLLGLLAGVVMVMLVWWTLIDVRGVRERLETDQARLAKARLLLDQQLSQQKWEFLDILRGKGPAVSWPGDLPMLVAEYRRSANPAGASGLGKAFKQLDQGVADLERLRQDCLSWQMRRQQLAAGLPQAQEKVEQALSRMDEAVEQAYGQQRLARAVRIRQYRQLAPAAAASLARQIIDDLAAAPDLSVVRRDLADLALLCERLQREDHIDFLADLKDNRIRTVLARLHWSARAFIRHPAMDWGLTESMLTGFETALFGKGYAIEDDHQTVLPGQGGLYRYSAERLQLESERQSLQVGVAAGFDRLHRTLETITGEVESSRQTQTLELESALHNAWRSMLLILAATALLFLLIASRIITVARRQIEAIKKSNAALDAQARELFASREQLRQSEERLHHLSRSLLDAQENERRRIARELHDELGQAMAALKLQVRAAERSLGREVSPALQTECSHLRQDINSIIENVRRLSKDLSPVVLEDLGFEAAVRHLAETFARLHDVRVNLQLEEISHLLSEEAQRNIYRILQELLTNIGRHAQAGQVWVAGRQQGSTVRFQVKDDGRGFDPAEVKRRRADRGLGLNAVAERVYILGGTLDVQSASGQGTMVSFTAPV